MLIYSDMWLLLYYNPLKTQLVDIFVPSVMLYWMSSEFILVAASSVVLCQASVYFNKKNNEHEDSFIVWELTSVHGTAFYSEINGILKVSSASWHISWMS